MLKKIIFPLLLAIALFSCKTSEDMAYLKDMSDKELQDHIPQKPVEYRIKKDDNLYVKILTTNPEVNMLFSQSQSMQSAIGTQQMYGDLTSQFLNGNIVDQNGEITLPILGNIRLEGLTIPEAQAAVNKKAGDFLKEYTVQVKLLSFKITMVGEFRSPGIYYNYNNNITILEAISKAGGITDYGKINNLMVVRPTPEGYKSYLIDLSSEKILTSEAFYLQPDDVIYARPDKNKNIALNSLTYSLLLSSITTLLVLLQYFKF
jgi:polysaccharide export outer membrane protein